jgi:hypothetical protein
MKTENKIENLLNEFVGNLSNDELNTLFIHFDMYVYTDNYFNRYLCLDDDKQIELINDAFLFYYFIESIKYYQNKLKDYGKLELKKQINSLIKL